MVYGLSEEGAELTLAARWREGGYIPRRDLIARLGAHRSMLPDGAEIGFDPCAGAPCHHGGVCSPRLDVGNGLVTTESSATALTAPSVSHHFHCTCPTGFSGPQCQSQEDPCSPNPCLHQGTCHGDGLCICPPSRHGPRCELALACSSSPCHNGGTCQQTEGDFFCLCRPGFRGKLCQTTADSCRPNRCMHGGTCLPDGPAISVEFDGRSGLQKHQCVGMCAGYQCMCESSYYGRHCEHVTVGFKPYSFMSFPSELGGSTTDLSIVFSTLQSNALLVYNFGNVIGGRSDFVALELVQGRPTFSFGGVRTAVATVSAPQSVADGSWHKVSVVRNGRLSIFDVTELNEYVYKRGVSRSSLYLSSPAARLGSNVRNVTMATSPAPSSHLVTLGRSLSMEGRPMYVGGVPSIEPMVERPGQVGADDFVGCLHSVVVSGRRLDLATPLEMRHVGPGCPSSGPACPGHCLCDNGLVAHNCHSALEPIWISGDARVELVPQEKLRRGLWKGKARSLSLAVRTNKPQGQLLRAVTQAGDLTTLSIEGGRLVYRSTLKNGGQFRHEIDHVADGHWHAVVMTSGTPPAAINISLDGRWHALRGRPLHDFLDPYLSLLTIGGGFEGCVKLVAVNGEVQSANASTSYFQMVAHGPVRPGCQTEGHATAAPSTDPLNVGIMLVIVFFIILILVIFISFVVFRQRKMAKNHLKPNGTPYLASSPPHENGGPRNDSLYHEATSAEDLLRNHLAQELMPKKLKEREVPHRPDIIEKEVMNKSLMSPRMEDHMMPPKSSNNSLGILNITESEPPEHYDLENASSIAPSDIDIVYHYKAFRDGNFRKYKPNVTGYHKHRHGLGEGPTKMQNTPLARLSPSSELSQPRILTLQDLSGRPLQSALLAHSPTASLHSAGPQSASGLTAEEIQRLNVRPRNASLLSTLDAVSSSSDGNMENNKLSELENNPQMMEVPQSSSSESGNDSFTCSEYDYDNYEKVHRDYPQGNLIFSKLPEEDNENDGDSAKTYDGLDSFRGSLSTLVASDEEITYKPSNGGTMVSWDYLLNWGPNFQNLAGVFQDIAQLPDNPPTSSANHSEEMV
ncbi:FAT4 [Cordylochernes scorpioides]|uniref:FAT4 n=1 Tax=Cordylochernes scorpioides TaxID=51811 RepID=A0ABY6K6A0_9ARAC|nr:FAT4 [Cordylochernes scorpioides]